MTHSSESAEIPIGAVVGRYRTQRALGRGGMATVIEVEHLDSGEVRALKLLRGDLEDREVEERFRAEFKALSSLDHPNVLKVFDAGVYDGRAWFVMERLTGQDLREAIEGWRQLPPAERFTLAESVLTDVAEALAYIHERGLVHRDITPGNIRVTESGAAKLMDFGVVHLPGAELTTVGEMVGTVAYIAPEQISHEVNGGRVDGRADLYALGAVLYHMLTGRRPFQATTVPGLLEKHLSTPPKPPRELVPTVPAHLNDICLRLLEKDPNQRYGSARHLLDVLRAKGPRRLSLKGFPSRTAGRTAELARLRALVSGLKTAGRGAATLLEGPSGLGKSRLLRELVVMARDEGLKVVGAICPANMAPYGGLRALLSALEAAGHPLPPTLQQLRLGEGDLEPYPVMAATRELLSSLGPTVVLLDDLHHADRGTLKVLEFLLRNHLQLQAEPLLFGFARQPPAGADPLEAWLNDGAAPLVERVELGPISIIAVEELLAQLLGDAPLLVALAQRLHQEGEGSPHLISEMIRGLAEEGVIFDEGGRWRLGLDERAVSHTPLPVPGSIREALKERLRGLKPEVLRVAALVALCPHEVTPDVILEATGGDEHALDDALDELTERGVLRVRQVGQEELVELSQARMRDVLVDSVPSGERAALHRRLGGALERLYRQRVSSVVETLAWHFERGELPAKAYPYLVKAGVRLLERSFVAEALTFFNRALALEPAARELLILEEADRQLAELRIQRGLSLFHLGSWAEAHEDWTLADSLAIAIGDDRLRARTLNHLGRDSLREHRIDEAEERLSQALQLANRLGDHSLRADPLYGLGTVRWYRADMDGARNFWLECLTVGGTVRNDEAMGHGYNGLGLVAFCRGQAAEARKYLEQSAQVFEKLGKLGPLAVVRVNLVELAHVMGNLRKGQQIAERTISQAREINHPYGVALGLRFRSLILQDVGRLIEADDNAEEALRLCRTLDNHEEELAVYVFQARVAVARRDTARLGLILDAADPLSLKFDSEGFRPLLRAWRAWLVAAEGDVAGCRALIAEADQLVSRPWPHQRCRLELVIARAFAEAGLGAEAALRAEAALKGADECGFRLYSLKAHALLARVSEGREKLDHHRRLGTNLARSLAANLNQEDVEGFLALYGAARQSPL